MPASLVSPASAEAVLHGHVHALGGVLTSLLGYCPGDVEVDMVLDEENETRSHLLYHCSLDVRVAARSRNNVADGEVDPVGHLIQVIQRAR